MSAIHGCKIADTDQEDGCRMQGITAESKIRLISGGMSRGVCQVLRMKTPNHLFLGLSMNRSPL